MDLNEDIYEGLEALDEHVRGGRIDTDYVGALHALRFLSPEWTGPVYRGLKVSNKQAARILDNRRFAMEDRRHRTPIESWSSSPYSAAYFAIPRDRKDTVGVLVAARPSLSDRLLVLGDEFADNLEHQMDEWEMDTGSELGRNLLDAARIMRSENEVMVEARPGRRYDLCRNIVRLFVNRFDMVNTKDPGAVELRDALAAKVEDWDSHLNRSTFSNVMVLACDSRGSVKWITDMPLHASKIQIMKAVELLRD